MPPAEIVPDDSAIGVMCNDVFGEGWGGIRIAHLSPGDKIGVDIFELKNAGRRENNSFRITMTAGPWQEAS